MTTTPPARHRPPDTTATRAADAVCARYADGPLAAHSLRSYLWAAEYAVRRGIDHDAEVLYVAALVHDLGLVPAFDVAGPSFEVVGGDLAWVVGTAAGWEAGRAERARTVAVMHMQDDLDPAVDAESALLQVGTSADVSGLRVDTFTAAFRQELFARHPRGDFDARFVAALRDQAVRKPESSAAAALAGGIAERVAGNRLPRG